MPSMALAAGLVPCGGPGETACEFCHVVSLMDNVVTWLVAVLGTITAILFIVSGMRLVTSGGNPAAKQSAKSMMVNAAIGFAIVLAAWLIIDFVMKSLVDSDDLGSGFWNTISCSGG